MRITNLASLFVLAATATLAQTVTVLASFDQTNGNGANSILQASDGNFYGTTADGGAGLPNCDSGVCGGTVFKLTPSGTLTTLYNFNVSPGDGSVPAPGLVQATDGNLYGTTSGGGSNGTGIIYRITTSGQYTLLFATGQISAGYYYSGGLVQAPDGNFYGAAAYGGANSLGTFFMMTPSGAVTPLYSFDSTTGRPAATVVQGTDGNFYGTTEGGNVSCFGGCGTVFKLTPAGQLTLLHTFGATATDGTFPSAPLIQASDGNFYGTTEYGGTGNCMNGKITGCGTIFKITPSGTLTTLYSFGASSTDGKGPAAALLQGADGNLYGTTMLDGQCVGTLYTTVGCGSIFRISTAGAFTTLHHFGAPGDGAQPAGALIQAKDGSVYGTTAWGGANYYGTVFRLTLPAADTPAIAANNGVLNGASFQPGISSGAWITISGQNLSTMTGTWATSITNGALPTSLDGVSVTVGGQPAYIEYVSATQINAVAPNFPVGSVPVIVTNANGTSQAVNAQLSAETPAFFQWGAYAVATHQDYTYAVKNGTFAGLTTVPAAPGDVIILWGTGFGPTSPAAPNGMETPSTTTYNTATAVSVTVGGKSATVYGAALAPGYAGLYQIAIQIPAGLANGDYAVVATINGSSSPSTTLITIQQ